MFKKTDPNKERLEKLHRIKIKLESDDISKSMISLYKKYNDMTAYEKNALKKTWDEYYDQVRSTIAYQRCARINQLTKTKCENEDVEELKQLLNESREQIESQSYEIKKPHLDDPLYVESNYHVNLYKKTLSEIKTIKDQVLIDGKTDAEVACEISKLLT
jgi:hypothetical protein